MNDKNKTNLIKGSVKGKVLDFTILKDEKSIYEYKLIKNDAAYYGENFITNFKTYKKNIDLEAIKPFLYSKVNFYEETLDINIDEEISKCLSTKDPLLNVLDDLMEKYETSTISETFHKRAMIKAIECLKK